MREGLVAVGCADLTERLLPWREGGAAVDAIAVPLAAMVGVR